MNLTVTDHAIVRYFERVLNIDVEAIRKKIATPHVDRMVKVLGDGKFPAEDEFGNKFKIVVSRNRIVTLTISN